MKLGLNNLLKELKQKANYKKAKILLRFFKTGNGEYGEGDLFLGITVPESRKIALKYSQLSLVEISKLIQNKYHEARLVALLILVHQYKTADQKLKKKIYNFYLKNTKYINNWDLVDLSASYIVGDYLFNNKKGLKILEKLIKSKNLWERRIAVLASFSFIKNGQIDLTLKITKRFLNDPEDLIHKACGWMLREAGKRVSESKLEAFLGLCGPKMPRVMLRYAIERLPQNKRLKYLKNK